jgi:glucose-1-phosphatase
MNKPRLLLFDLGNVLVKFVPEQFPKSLGLELHDAQGQYENEMRNLTNQYECGKFSTKEFFASLRSFLDNRFEIRTLEQAFLSVLTDPIPGMEDLVQRAAARVSSALVSNTNEFHFTSVLPKVPALNYLPRRYLSYQVGAIKPSQEFYLHVIRNEKVAPDEMLFIDDVEQNVRSAEQAGMAGYRFRNAAGLEKELARLGVL